MSEYTPDEEQVREQYTQEQPPQIGSVAEKRAEFDRFIARIKAEAWREAADFLAKQRNLDDDVVPGVQLAASGLRWRAGQIENGDNNE